MRRRPRSPDDEEEERNVRSRPIQPQPPQPQPQPPQPQPPQPQRQRNQYIITSRIDPNRRNEYSNEQLSAAPFLHGITLPHLSELFRSKVAAYRAIKPEDISKVLILIRIRTAFKKLVHAALIRKCNKIPFQEVDPITLSHFVTPVIVYDIKNRCRHKFEAKTLMVHIHRQLLHGSIGFPEPLQPRNPLTNIELTYGQLVSCYFQLRDAGQSIWTLAGFYSLNFNLSKFSSTYELALRQAANKASITDDMNEFSADQFVRFIQAYATHNQMQISEINIYVLRYAAIMRPTDYYMICWKRLYLIALAHNIPNGPVNTIFNDLETVAQARGLVVLTRILSQNMQIYIREIRPSYDRFIEENESKEDEDSIFGDDEDSEEEAFGAYYNLLHTILGPGASAPYGPGAASGPSANRG